MTLNNKEFSMHVCSQISSLALSACFPPLISLRVARVKKWISLLGLAVVSISAVTTAAADAPIFTTIASFCVQPCADGADLIASLIQATDGSLYGASGSGGVYNQGTIFKITTNGILTTLHSFDGYDGSEPQSALIQATDGNFYGTASSGGPLKSAGTIFKMKPDGSLSTIYAFCSQANCTDGETPFSGLVQGTNGALYGSTYYGGGGSGTYGGGTLFKLMRSGALTTLFSFCAQPDCAEGYFPGPLIRADNNDFYGTTLGGGGVSGAGTIFQLTQRGELTTRHVFRPKQVVSPNTMIQAADGDFYGTGDGSQITPNFGVIYHRTRGGETSLLYVFCSTDLYPYPCLDGKYPEGGLIEATDGNLYGTTREGGTYGAGTIFQITPGGVLTTLYSFCAVQECADGYQPFSGLVQATDGNLYGTTFRGGIGGTGTVFRLSLGLGPFVKTQTKSGKVASIVTILGDNLANATGVRFHDTVAAFTIVSTSEIIATVPNGATSGFVVVTTPAATLRSSTKFIVRL
jgi:uncharacterized repeat protein (TIGR03803 family)